MSTYLIINIAVIGFPFVLSFDKKVAFYKKWKHAFPAMVISGLFFISWDSWFAKLGVWGFSKNHLAGPELFHLPIEEWLFFITVPYAFIFTYECIRQYFPSIGGWTQFTRAMFIILMISTLVLLVLFSDRLYTSINFLLALILLIFALATSYTFYSFFMITYLIILLPFLLINGLLTGMFLENPVVWYNNNENMGIRIFTIPLEDTLYAFNMFFLSTVMYEKFQGRN
ncbi:MAG: lycopene cyclase domain-containing protein [Bacteroidetes bacterium]|jgi:lycopene cyclase domain-containing protein|nr:lycopene cyclase domain-containing protein [Bacteroidota bacterium]